MGDSTGGLDDAKPGIRWLNAQAEITLNGVVDGQHQIE